MTMEDNEQSTDDEEYELLCAPFLMIKEQIVMIRDYLYNKYPGNC